MTLFIDISYASCTIYLTAGGTSFVWLLYVLLYIGFGARYGVKFLYAAAVITLLQYNFLLLFTNLWSQIPLDLISQMLVLSLLPLYLNSLFLRLHIAKTEAEKLTQLKSKFLASMTHEIRTPLNGIIGVTRLLENTPLNSLQKKYIRALGYSSQLLHGLIDDILDFSKIEADKFEINTAQFHVRNSITQVIESLTPKTPKCKQTLRVNIADSIPEFLNGDKQRIQQVLVNLISNALKSTNPQTGHIKLNLKPEAHDSHDICLVRFEVIDNGIGIDEQAQKTIFDNYTQFNQSESSTQHQLKPAGTGLGTAIVKELVDLMGGSICLKSQKGKGSTFYFSLPLQRVEKTTDDKAHILSHSTQKSNLANHSLHILVAEDDEINAMVSEQFLKDLGHTVAMVADGKQAMQLLLEEQYDMIFMDMHMPHASGLQVTEQFRQNNRATPIIGLTANATVEHRDACLAAGMNDFLSKPITPEQLAEIIEKTYCAITS